MAADEGLRPFMLGMLGLLCVLLPRGISGQIGCPDKVTQLSLNDSVTIQSPNYPEDYINNFRCEWRVTPAPMRRVLVKFMDFRLDSIIGDDFFHVGIITNPRALAYDGYKTPQARILSPANESLIFEFITGRYYTDRGFSLLVMDAANEEYDMCPNGLEIVSETYACYGCPDEITQLSLNASVTIQSSSYPAYYTHNLHCEWRVIPAPMHRVLAHFLDFELHLYTANDRDYLYAGIIGDSRIIAYAGSTTPQGRILSPVNGPLLFEFVSGEHGADQGFSLLVMDEAGTTDYDMCPNGLEIVSEAYACYGCPTEITQLSLNASVTIQSSSYPAKYPNNLNCEWRVTPAPMRRVLAQFLEFELHASDSFYVGLITNPRTLSYIRYAPLETRILSPVNESLMFEFITSPNLEDRGFSLLLMDEADNDYNMCPNGLEILSEISACNGCPIEITQLSLNDSFTIQSSGYPGHSPINLHCEWRVTPAPMRRVLVQFIDFNLSYRDDLLYVGIITNPRALTYTGPLLQQARIISPVNASLIFEFITDRFSSWNRGFSLLVMDEANEDYDICPNGLEILNETYACYGCPDEVTQLTLNAAVTIQSSSYPAYYTQNLHCQWRVNPAPMRRVLVQFIDFDVDHYGDDTLYVGITTNPRALSYIDTVTPQRRIISPVNEGLIFEFITGQGWTSQGFSLLVMDAGNEDYELCPNGLEMLSEEYGCNGCPDEVIQLSVNDAITINSSSYPANYANNLHCEWIVTPAPMRRILLRFMDFSLDSWIDRLYIGTIANPRVLAYTRDVTPPQSIISPVNESLQFEFITDDIYTYGGFSLLLTDEMDENYELCPNGLEMLSEEYGCYGCPDEVIQLAVNDAITIKSSSYPAKYPNNLHCEWIVTPAAMRRVLLRFMDFSLRAYHDFLYIGTIANPRVLAYTRDVTPQQALIISPVNESLQFEFITDDAHPGRGFSLLLTDEMDENCPNGLQVVNEGSPCYDEYLSRTEEMEGSLTTIPQGGPIVASTPKTMETDRTTNQEFGNHVTTSDIMETAQTMDHDGEGHSAATSGEVEVDKTTVTNQESKSVFATTSRNIAADTTTNQEGRTIVATTIETKEANLRTNKGGASVTTPREEIKADLTMNPESVTIAATTRAVATTKISGCLPFPVPGNAVIDLVKDLYAFGDVINVYCRQGFALTGDERLICSNTGIWHGEIPRCSAENQGGCLPFPIPGNAVIDLVKDLYAFGDVINVYCRQGFALTGDERLICSNTGVWHGEIPGCSAENQGGCLPFPEPENAVIDLVKDLYDLGDVINVYCRKGFALTGDERLICSNTGIWHGEIPRCSAENQGDDSMARQALSRHASTAIIASVVVGGVIIIIIIVLIVMRRKRKYSLEQPGQLPSSYLTYLPSETDTVEHQQTDNTDIIPLNSFENRLYESSPNGPKGY
ncbi:cubilin-like [Amphiura filiformis]|uniref:cubilin-like n=1 Tax=Amphiura filiformis TaxID=82378 RepID=UPI003B2167F4